MFLCKVTAWCYKRSRKGFTLQTPSELHPQIFKVAPCIYFGTTLRQTKAPDLAPGEHYSTLALPRTGSV